MPRLEESNMGKENAEVIRKLQKELADMSNLYLELLATNEEHRKMNGMLRRELGHYQDFTLSVGRLYNDFMEE